MFRFFSLTCNYKDCGLFLFSVLASCAVRRTRPGLRVFSDLVSGFRFLSTMMAVFRIFLANAFYGLAGIAKEVTSRTFAKAVFPRDHLYTVGGMYGMSSLFSIRY